MLNEILKELFSYTATDIKLGLNNIEKICSELGEPQKNYKVIHIAGTNGKGSTSTMIERGLIEAGYRVGKYTSPHILRFNERIVVDGFEIKDEEIVYYYSIIKEIIERLEIKATFFEITTAIMFKYFSDKKVDYAVIEVGLGGSYDATNVVNSDYAVITNVTYDHLEFLGNNLFQIAKEKAGIIKKNSKVFIGSSQEHLIQAISEKSKNYIDVEKKYCTNSTFELDFEKFITKISIAGREYRLALFGEHQYKNFLLAYEVLRGLGVKESQIERMAESVEWKGRFETIKIKDKIVILDGAHNEDSAKVLTNALEKGIRKEEIVAIVSILKDKEIEKIVKLLEENVSKIIFTSLIENKRGESAKELFENSENKKNKLYYESLEEAFETSLKMESRYILVCGSFYLLAKFKERLLNEAL